MMIASIDLMGGKAVQLRQGKDLVLTSDRDPIELAREFNRYGEVAVIDLDAAFGNGDNLDLVRQLCRVADVRAGGGIRDAERGRMLLQAGAKRIIVGTAATPELLQSLPRDRTMVALDHRNGEVVDHAWTQGTGEFHLDRARRLAPYCGSFLCTFVADEGMMNGSDIPAMAALARQLDHPVTVAGGIATTEEVISLSRLGLDVQVGMALYTGKLDPAEAIVGSLDFEKCPLMPTIVRDEAGQVLMLAYSTPDSLRRALQEGKGIYFSRTQNAIWEKGATSGHTQVLESCRVDCDRDTLLFTVRQAGPACHTKSYSCFGSGLKAPEFSLPHLFETLRQRKADMPDASYAAKLFNDRKLLTRKLLEEAAEVVTAHDRQHLVWELADLLFFMSAFAADEDVSWKDIVAQLGGRVT